VDRRLPHVARGWSIADFTTAALLVAGYSYDSDDDEGGGRRDSAEITKLLADAKTEAVELQQGSADMESFQAARIGSEAGTPVAQSLAG
jgi:hypothetical protein